jgi:pyruvate/2-oxoglutarate dehydrogenase complex dihydrolipoamide acyltransferase (E2) component
MDSTFDQSGDLLEEIPVGNPADLADEEQPDTTDAAREKADVLSVDLSRVEGSGAGGRITINDVERSVQRACKENEVHQPKNWAGANTPRQANAKR